MLEDAKWNMRWAKRVLLNVNNFTLSEGLIPKLISKVEVPFPIVERLFKNMYKWELSPDIKVRSTFHVSLLKPFENDTLWPDRKQVIRPPPDLVRSHLKCEVEGILELQPRQLNANIEVRPRCVMLG